MEKFFNTEGPMIAEDHYIIDPLTRFELDEIERLITRKRYFILHAPRQVGKTSYLLALMDHLNAQGKVRCLYVNVEGAQAARENVADAMQAILNEIAVSASDHLKDNYPKEHNVEILKTAGPFSALSTLLSQWSEVSPLPLVLFIDEVDALIGDTLISVLRQLRAGYYKRPNHFPQSVILCGIRDVRDYRIHSIREKEIITGGSAFNIKAKSLQMESFTHEDVRVLYQQHTDETGQNFTEDALEQVWQLTKVAHWLAWSAFFSPTLIRNCCCAARKWRQLHCCQQDLLRYIMHSKEK
ncbi:MAG: AAA family ATPase, partial [Chloroflexota bacterium]